MRVKSEKSPLSSWRLFSLPMLSSTPLLSPHSAQESYVTASFRGLQIPSGQGLCIKYYARHHQTVATRGQERKGGE